MYKIFKLIGVKKDKKDEVIQKNYYKCDYPTMMSVKGYADILTDNNYSLNLKNYKIWLPGGYNDIDRKLKDVKITNQDQIFFAIPNCDNLVSKYNVWNSLEKKYGREHASDIIPESFLLNNEEHIKLLKEKNYEKLIIKQKKQRKEGLSIITDLNQIKESTEYKDEEIIQKMIEPFLVNGRKVNLRVYLMINMKNDKLDIYVNKYGSCIYTKDQYDKDSVEFEKNITSYKLDLDIYKENPQTFNQLKTYLKDKNINHNELFDKINNKVLLFIDAIKEQIGSEKFKNNLTSQVFGMDFIIDENMNPYLLECNKGPDMKPRYTMIYHPSVDDVVSKKFDDLKTQLIDDVVDLSEKIKIIKKFNDDIHKGYPKEIGRDVILKGINDYYKMEEELNSYPVEYINGTGFKVQKDALSLLGLIDNNENNGFDLIGSLLKN